MNYTLGNNKTTGKGKYSVTSQHISGIDGDDEIGVVPHWQAESLLQQREYLRQVYQTAIINLVFSQTVKIRS